MLPVSFGCLCIQIKAITNTSSNHDTSDVCSFTIQWVVEAQHIHLQLWEKDNTSPEQNLLCLTHSLLDNKSEFAFLLRPRSHLLWEKRVSPPRMSQQMKKLAEKSHLLVVTLMSPGSHRIMSPVACRLRDISRGRRLRGASDDCALHQKRGMVNTWICHVQGKNSLKNVAGKRTERRVENNPQECNTS